MSLIINILYMPLRFILPHKTLNKLGIKSLKDERYKIVKEHCRGRLLDIGCGEGFVTIEVAKKIKAKIVGIDKEKDAIKFAISNNKLENMEYSTGDIFKLDYFKDNSFDLVMSLEVLEHLENYEKAIEIMSKLSKKYLLLSVPNEPWFRMANVLRLKYLKRFGNTPGHVNNWTRKEFRALCMKYGKIIKFKTSGVWNIVLLKIR